MRGKGRTLEQQITRVASGQYGVVARRQLLRADARPSAIDRRIENGLLIPERRGVYRVAGAPASFEAKCMAAVLAGGDGTFLRGRAAGHLMRLLKGAAPPPEVTARKERRIKGVEAPRSRSLDRRDTWTHRGIPCTTVARTLVDLAAVLTEDELARAFHEASVLYRTRPEQVEAVLRRMRTAKGAAKLRRVLRGDIKVSLSKLEKRFLELLEENDLAPPETNERIDGRYVDCRWPERRLTIELDGYRYHGTRHAWEQDRKREREARRRGDDFRRFTWGDVFEEPGALIDELLPILRK